jgi:citrate synthase
MTAVVEKTSIPAQTARLQLAGQEFQLPVVEGTEHERGLDISKLLAATGCTTLDEGYANTGSTTSSVTFLDGDRGILRYRGYAIEELAAHCDFLEVAHLLIYGELPTAGELQTFRSTILRHTMIHEEMRKFYGGFPRDAHPMAILSAATSALSTFYQDSLDPADPRQVEVSIHRLLAKLPTIAAYSYKKSVGQPFVYPQNDLSYTANFLQMMFAVPCEP